MEPSPGWTTSWVTNQTSVNLRKLKFYQASYLTTCYENRYKLQLKKNCKKQKHMEINNTFLNNQQVTEKNQKGTQKFLETNDNEDMTT